MSTFNTDFGKLNAGGSIFDSFVFLDEVTDKNDYFTLTQASVITVTLDFSGHPNVTLFNSNNSLLTLSGNVSGILQAGTYHLHLGYGFDGFEVGTVTIAATAAVQPPPPKVHVGVFDVDFTGAGDDLFVGSPIKGSDVLAPGYTAIWAFGDFAGSVPIYITLKGSFDSGFPQTAWLHTIGTNETIPLVTVSATSSQIVYGAFNLHDLLYDFELTNNDSFSHSYTLSVSTSPLAPSPSIFQAAPVAAGNNFITGIPNNHDTAVFHDALTGYTITINPDLSVTVSGHLGRDGLNTVKYIEHLQFSDKIVFIEDTDGANIARLYSAALGRAPDVVGMSGWSDIYASKVAASAKAAGVYYSLAQADNGGGMSIAAGFTHSQEFLAKYGTLNDTQFVTQLYYNVLGRAPEAAGLNGWLNLMHGVNGHTREMVLVGFAESQENINKTAADWLIQI